jgi:hypothetical protein
MLLDAGVNFGCVKIDFILVGYCGCVHRCRSLPLLN